MHFNLGKIISIGSMGLLQEERTIENKYKKYDDLLYLFDTDKVTFLPSREYIKKGDIVWFSIIRPCGGSDLVDTIKKPFFPD